MKKLLLFILFPISLGAQKHDYVWLMGYESSLIIPGIEGVVADFSDSENYFTAYPLAFSIRSSNSSISDANGKLLFYTNGCTIANANNEIMVNGDSINPGEVHDIQCNAYGYTAGPQSTFILPMPDQDSIYYLFHKRIIYEYNPDFDVVSDKLLYTIVNMNLDGGNGAVIAKNQELWTQPQTFGELVAVKHANGKDWWIVSIHDASNEYLFFYLDSQGVSFHHSQIIGNEITKSGSGGAQTNFSPDGKRLVRYSRADGVFIFDFDRDAGLLSNFQHISIDDGTFFGGAVVSPNSSVLYIPTDVNLYQFDLKADDIAASKILIDTFDGYTSPFSTFFFMGQRTPDCKIYINTFATVDVLHVIHNPNELGTDCNFEQHAIQLPFNHLRAFPYFPNYRLGALAEEEEFLSRCESIVHTQEQPTMQIDDPITLFPNPATEEIHIRFKSTPPKQGVIWITDSFGKTLKTIPVNNTSQITISTTDLAPGLYYCQILDGHHLLSTEKFIIVR